MKGIKAFFRKSHSGATLMLVVGTFSILLILVTASLSAATTARRQTFEQYNKSQAYYVANSAVNTFVQGLRNNTDLKKMVLGISKGHSYVSKEFNVPSMGKITYRIKRDEKRQLIVTASVKYHNTESQSSVVLSGQLTDPKIPNFNAATVTLSSANYAESFEARGDVIGKSPADGTYLTFNNNVKVGGNVYVEGKLELNSFAQIYAGTNKSRFSVEATDEIYMTNDITISCPDYISKAYINTSLLRADSRVQIGTPTKKVNIYADSVSIGNSKSKLYSDVYLYKKDGKAPSYANMEGGAVINGDVYIEGDYVVNAASSANLLATGDIHVTGKLTVNGKVSCNKLYCGNLIENSGGLSCTEFHSPNAVGGSSGGAWAGRRKWDEDADSKEVAIIDKPEMSESEDVFAPYTCTEAEFQGYLNPDMFVASNKVSVPWHGTSTITKSCTLTGSTYEGTVKINVGAEPIWIKLDCDLNKTNFILNMSAGHPDTPVFFYLAKNKVVNIIDTHVISQQTLTKINAGETFYTGNSANPAIEVTKGQPVYWMLDKGAKISVGKNGIMEGYVYAPFNSGGKSNNIDLNNDDAGLGVKVSQDGLPTDEVIYPKLLGAIVVDSASISRGNMIVFLVPNQAGIPGIGTPPDAADFTIEKFKR